MLPESLIDKDRPALWQGSENSILRPFQYPVLKVPPRPEGQVGGGFDAPSSSASLEAAIEYIRGVSGSSQQRISASQRLHNRTASTEKLGRSLRR